ncbi:MAG: ferredoxin [Candidatus Omnitrophica bacterium CG11_big_fil_rev_8_21_14_0_20_64_10]|nr:MAG: ferredoxin [Candidatus Omnitrophica bacterium CG11_big_fil_rev_8_21_14_0_20_64_10]
MAYVITKKCLGEQYAACVEVCPVDCIYPGDHEGEPFMVIDPEICITCGACLPVCPIGAIVESEDYDQEYAKVNADLSPKFKGNPKVQPRPTNDPPRKPDNKLV